MCLRLSPLLHAGVFSCRSRQCLQVLVTRSSSPTTLLGVANPRHLLTRFIISCPQRMLCRPDIAHALAVYSRQCLQVLEARVFSLSLARRCGDQPKSLVHFSATCWTFTNPPRPSPCCLQVPRVSCALTSFSLDACDARPLTTFTSL